MSGARLLARQRGGTVDVDTNLAQLDPCCAEDVYVAVGGHLGFDMVELQKATLRRPPTELDHDPRFPGLRPLVLQARRDWQRHGDDLVAAVKRLWKKGKLARLSPQAEAELRELFAEHRVGFLVRFSGRIEDPATWAKVQATAGPPPAVDSLIEVAFRLGVQVDPASPIQQPKPPPTLGALVREAAQVQLDASERLALDYAQRSAAIYMRRPAVQAEDELVRVLNETEREDLRQLTEEQRQIVAQQVERGIEGRQDFREVARNLREAVQGHPSLGNDMERVARTELVFAHNHGAKERLKREAGEADPQVFKLVRPRACAHCLRIWGRPGAPVLYRLSEVERNDASGGNFRRPAAQWRAVTGPVHPNCTEGPLMLWRPEIHRAVQDTMAAYDKLYPAR